MIGSGEIDSEITSDGEIVISISGHTHTLSPEAASELTDSVKDSHQRIQTNPYDMLTVGRVKTGRYVTENPYHLHGKHGCPHKKRITHRREFDIVDLIDKHDNEISETDFDGKIESMFCRACRSAIEHWHTQRKIFLPKLARQMGSDAENDSKRVYHDIQQGCCSICGTPRSASVTLSVGFEIGGIESPVKVCPTCDGLLQRDGELPFSELDFSDHPLSTREISLTKPVTDPDAAPSDFIEKPYPENLLNGDVGDVGELPREEFIDMVKSFDGGSISKWTGRNLYNNGYRSIAALYRESVAGLQDTPMVSDQEGKELKYGVKRLLKSRIDS